MRMIRGVAALMVDLRENTPAEANALLASPWAYVDVWWEGRKEAHIPLREIPVGPTVGAPQPWYRFHRPLPYESAIVSAPAWVRLIFDVEERAERSAR